MTDTRPKPRAAPERILDAAIGLLAKEGVAGLSMRAVASEAGVAVGLANYHFENKTALISAALRQIGEKDLELVAPQQGEDAAQRLRHSLHQALDRSFLSQTYLSLRLQLWSLAGIDPAFAQINQASQQRYLDGLKELLGSARPDLSSQEVAIKATDILIVQNGVWLTAVLILDEAAVERALVRCESIAFG